MATFPGLDRISRSLAARVLTLLQTPEQIAIDLDDTDPVNAHDLPLLLHRVLRRHQSESLLARLPFGESSNGPMLGPNQRLPSTGAVLLAFHVGAEIDLETLSSALGISPPAAGDELYRTRMTLLGIETHACDRMRSHIGRYVDPMIDRESLSAIVNHTNACPQCSMILSEFRLLDEDIRQIVKQAGITPAATASELTSLRRNPLLLLVPIGLVIILAIASLAAIGYGAATQSGPIPLFASVDTDSHQGWLIISSEREILAFDLESGERRRILENPAHDWWNPWIISPGGKLVVRWEEASRVERRTGAIRAYDMNGDRQYLHRWDSVRSRTFSGWLDDQTVLFAVQGAMQRVDVLTAIPHSAQPSLVAANLDTGEEWIVYQGPMDKAVPSPDGKHLAVVRPGETPWVGKTLDILPIDGGEAGDPVASVEHRLLGWPGRLLWSDDGRSAFVSAIHRDAVPDQLPEDGEPAPGIYDFDRLDLIQVGIDGTVAEFAAPSDNPAWLVPQAIAAGNSEIAVVHNDSGDRDSDWRHGVVDLETGAIELREQSVPGARWWNSEALWSLDGGRLLTQRVADQRFSNGQEIEGAGSLVLSATDANGDLSLAMVFQDTTSLHLRHGTGLGMLRWVPDDVMRSGEDAPAERPQASTPRELPRASSSQRIVAQSSVASTGRYVLLQQDDSEAGSRERLIHLQAWSGTESGLSDAGEFSWLPREPAGIGVIAPDRDDHTGSRLLFVSTDRMSPLHGVEFDPAGLGDQVEQSYRAPVVSPNGGHLAFFIQNEQDGETRLWIDQWDSDPVQIDSWRSSTDRLIDPSLILTWINDREFIYSSVTNWSSGYPEEIALIRGELQNDHSIETEEIRTFNARGRDRGIDLVDIAIGPDNERIAFRLRHYSGSDPEGDVSDSILVSPAQDLSQHIEAVRSGTGHGMIWLSDGRWLVAGIDERIALIESTGREIDYVSGRPAGFPVLIDRGEFWYQDLAEDGVIMQVTLD